MKEIKICLFALFVLTLSSCIKILFQKETIPYMIYFIIENKTSVDLTVKLYFTDLSCNFLTYTRKQRGLIEYEKERHPDKIETFKIGNNHEYSNDKLFLIMNKVFTMEEPLSLFIDSMLVYDDNGNLLYKQAPIDDYPWTLHRDEEKGLINHKYILSIYDEMLYADDFKN